MNICDLQKAIEDRLRAAVERAMDRADGSDLYDTAFYDGMVAAEDIVEGVFYEWGEMISNAEQVGE